MSLIQQIRHVLSLSSWFKSNALSVNYDQMCFILFHPSKDDLDQSHNKVLNTHEWPYAKPGQPTNLKVVVNFYNIRALNFMHFNFNFIFSSK